MNLSKMFAVIPWIVLNLPLTIYAADCSAILAKLPQHNAGSSDLAKMVDNFEKECRTRTDAANPDVYHQCIIAGMRSLAVSGNFIAAERMAKIECEAGNDAISKTWMGMVLNNNNASETDKKIAQEAIDNNQ